MKAKEKAKEFFDKMYDKVEDAEIECGTYCMGGSFNRRTLSKQCALIAVDEIILSIIQIHNDMTWGERKQTTERNTGYAYWTDVKQEIEKL